jgi:hypothetical protein
MSCLKISVGQARDSSILRLLRLAPRKNEINNPALYKQILCSLQDMILHIIYANTRLMAGSQKSLTCLQRNYICNKCIAVIQVRPLDLSYSCNLSGEQADTVTFLSCLSKAILLIRSSWPLTKIRTECARQDMPGGGGGKEK